MASTLSCSMALFALIVYIIDIVFNSLAETEDYLKLFPNSSENVYEEHAILMSPVLEAWSGWILVYIWTLSWLVYAFICTFKTSNSATILKTKTYGCFVIGVILSTGWLFSWAREQIVISFIIILIAQIFLELALMNACVDLHVFLEYNTVGGSLADVWCHRILVQNGLLYFVTWSGIVFFNNTGVLLHEEVGASDQAASIVVLVFLMLSVIVWFALENFAFQTYTDYTFSAYIALIWSISGMLARSWGVDDAVGGLSLALLILTIILFIVRIVLIVLRSQKKTSYENISPSYNAESNTVRT